MTYTPPPLPPLFSANDFIERQTRNIEREFATSRPRPRNRAMGFKGSDRVKPERLTYTAKPDTVGPL